MDPNSLTHYGVKGMKWGVRRTPAQLGHSPAGRKKNGAAASISRAGNAAAKKVASVKKARRDKIVAKAMASDASIKDLRKAIPYMTDAEIKKKMDRQSLENKLVDSNKVHEQKTSELGKSAKAIKKGADIGLTGASKTLNQEYVTQTLKPLTVAAGKAAGQKLLSVGADVAVGAAAKKLGVDEATAKRVAEQFKTVMAEDFAAAASSERRDFTSKNNLGEDWAKAKENASKLRDQEQERQAKRRQADREAAAFRAGVKAGARQGKKDRQAAEREARKRRKANSTQTSSSTDLAPVNSTYVDSNTTYEW